MQRRVAWSAVSPAARRRPLPVIWTSFAYAVGCFLALLAVQMQFFLFLPVEIPAEWRTKNRPAWEGTFSQRFLDLVWTFDKLRNSMPSMHVSVATMVDLTIWNNWP